MRSGSKRSPSKSSRVGESKDEEQCPPWVQGIKCVLDVTLTHDHKPRLTPPIRQYLEEVSLGMVGGPGDAHAQAHSAKEQADDKRKPCDKATPIDCMKVMMRVIATDPAIHACQSLFWLVLGASFGVVPAEVTPAFRKQLGEAWYAFSLQVMTSTQGGQEVQDWILAAMPCVFAQAIYRLLVDGFIEDRKQFAGRKSGQELVNKVSFITHFELTGFQITGDTLRRLRQRLFLRQVVHNPSANQLQVMKGKKRQEILESTADKDQPLAFAGVEARKGSFTPRDAEGRLAVSVQPLEEAQLEHLLQFGDHRRDEVAKLQLAGKALYEIEPTPVPTKFSVARYKDLAEGGLIFERHLAELEMRTGNAEEEDGNDDTPEEEEAFMPNSPSADSEPQSPLHSMAGSPRYSEGGDTTEISEATSQPATPSRGKSKWGKARLMVKVLSCHSDSKRRKEKEKEREEKTRRMKQAMLVEKCENALSAEHAQRTLNTTWVSPAMMSLQNADDRRTLKKTSSESFQLKMAVRPQPLRRLSVPALKSAAKDKSPARRGKALESCGGSLVSPDRREDSVAGSVRTGAGQRSEAGAGAAGASRQRPTTAGNEGPSSATSAAVPPASLPRVASAGAKIKPEAAGLDLPAPVGAERGAWNQKLKKVSQRGEAESMMRELRLEMQQMQAQDKANQIHSFAIYTKEHEVTTGVRKKRFDARRLRDEEDACVKKYVDLLGGPAKRQIPPVSLSHGP